MNDKQIREALRAAIIAAINEVGLDAFKRTSLFMSNCNGKVAA